MASFDQSRIQGFGSDTVEKEGNAESIWGSALSSWKDRMGGPAVQSAIDSVTLRVGDVFEAATQDMSDMAGDFKSFVSNTLGRGDDSDEEDEGEATKVEEAILTDQQRSEASQLVGSFCENYPAARVAPKLGELEAFWMKLSLAHPMAVCGAIYEQISFTSGDTDWRPRLRALHALEYIHGKGDTGRDITIGVWHLASSLLEHLATEVPQCKEKATQVILLLSGRAVPVATVPAADAASATVAATTYTAKETAASSSTIGSAANQAASVSTPAATGTAVAPAVATNVPTGGTATTPTAPVAATATVAQVAPAPPAQPPDLLDFVAPTRTGSAAPHVPAAGRPEAPFLDLFSVSDPAPATQTGAPRDLNFFGTLQAPAVASVPVVPAPVAAPAPATAPLAAGAGSRSGVSDLSFLDATSAADAPFDPNKPTGSIGSMAGLDFGSVGSTLGSACPPFGSARPNGVGAGSGPLGALGSAPSGGFPSTNSAPASMGYAGVPSLQQRQHPQPQPTPAQPEQPQSQQGSASGTGAPSRAAYLAADEWQSAMSAMSPSRYRQPDPFSFLQEHTGIGGSPKNQPHSPPKR